MHSRDTKVTCHLILNWWISIICNDLVCTMFLYMFGRYIVLLCFNMLLCTVMNAWSNSLASWSYNLTNTKHSVYSLKSIDFHQILASMITIIINISKIIGFSTKNWWFLRNFWVPIMMIFLSKNWFNFWLNFWAKFEPNLNCFSWFFVQILISYLNSFQNNFEP